MLEEKLTYADVTRLTGFTSCVIRHKYTNGQFPKPVDLSSHFIQFEPQEVFCWILMNMESLGYLTPEGFVTDRLKLVDAFFLEKTGKQASFSELAFCLGLSDNALDLYLRSARLTIDLGF